MEHGTALVCTGFAVCTAVAKNICVSYEVPLQNLLSRQHLTQHITLPYHGEI